MNKVIIIQERYPEDLKTLTRSKAELCHGDIVRAGMEETKDPEF